MRALIFIACIAVVANAAQSKPSNPSQGSKNPTPTAQTTSQQVAQTPAPVIVNVVPPENIKVETHKSPEDRTHGDESERRTLLTNWVLAVIVFLQLIVFGWQGWQLRRTVGEMETGTAATKEVAQAVSNTFAAIGEDSKRRLRAYVHVFEKKMLGVDIGQDPVAVITFKNTGATPARDVKIWLTTELFGMNLAEDYTFKNTSEGSKSVLPPGGVTIGQGILGRALTDFEVFAIQADKQWLSVFGKVEYRDVFGRDCWTTFRLRSDGAARKKKGTYRIMWEPDGNDCDTH